MESDSRREGPRIYGKGSTSAAILVCNGHRWKDAIKRSDEKSWNVALVTWRVISRIDGSCHVNTAEDDDGLDGIEKRAYIFDERRCFTAMDDIGILEPKHTAPTLQPWMKGDHGDSNQEKDDAIIPGDYILCFAHSLFNLDIFFPYVSCIYLINIHNTVSTCSSTFY